MKTRKRILAILFAVLLTVSILPAGTFAEDPVGGEGGGGEGGSPAGSVVTAQNPEELDNYLNDPLVGKVIYDGDLEISGEFVLHKDLEILGEFTISKHSIFVVADGTLILSGDSEIGQGARLTNRSAIVNAVGMTMYNDGIIMTISPAELSNEGSIENSGEIWMVDKIVGAEDDENNEPAVWKGDPPSLPSPILRVADVSTEAALIYAMDSSNYSEIWLSDLGVIYNTEGELIKNTCIRINEGTLDGNPFIITKPFYIFKDDILEVEGDIVIAEPNGDGQIPLLSIEGMMDTLRGESQNGNFTNSGYLYVDGILNIDGEATNRSIYTLTPRGTINNNGADLLNDEGDEADYSRGYYVETQDDWDIALGDADHCYEILIGSEASDEEAIKVSGEVELTCNLRVGGDLIINDGASLTLNRRFDHGTPYAYDEGNHIFGTVTNNGTLNANVWMDICGTLENNGTINLVEYDGDDNGQNWTTDGHIYLYSFFDETQESYLDGFLVNFGIINNLNCISINHNSSLENWPSGEIYNYGEITQWFRYEDAEFPLNNFGLIYGNTANLDYIHLCYQWLDRDGDIYFEPEGEINTEAGFLEQPTHMQNVLFMLYDYDDAKGEWGYMPIDYNDLAVGDSENPIFEIGSMQDKVSDNEELTVNNDKYASVQFFDWGENYIEYKYRTGEYSPVLLLPVSVDLPGLGFYREMTPSKDSYINTFGGFDYAPNSEPVEDTRTFYMIADIDDEIMECNPSFEYEISMGSENVSVKSTYDNSGAEPVGDKRVYKLTINDNVYNSFPIYIKLFAKDGEEEIWQGERFILIDETVQEGLVFTWPDWREGQNGDYRFNYPILPENSTEYKTKADIAIGGTSVAFFFRHQAEDDSWVYDPVSFDLLNVVENDSGLSMSQWQDANAGVINDPEHTGPEAANYLFTQLDAEKLGNYTLRYTVVNGETSTNYDLPITAKLPDVAFYSAASATIENYIDSFSYSPESRTFYMIANPDFEPGEGITSEYEVHDGADKFNITPVEDTVGVYSVTVKDGVSGEARFHGKIRLLDNGNEIWSSDRDIFVSEAEVEGLVFSWPPQWRTYDEEGFRFDYPVLTGEINYETRATTSLGNPTLALFHRYMGDEGWIYDPVAASEVTIIGDNPDMAAEDWAAANGVQGVIIDDGEYAAYEFTQIPCFELGDYDISYTVGEGEAAKTFTLPLTVTLPEVGFYSNPSMDSQDMEANFIQEFAYTPSGKTFYAIILTPEGYKIKNVFYGDDNVTIVQVGDSPVYSITLKENASREFNLNFRAEFENNTNSEDKPSSDMWINIHEGEHEGLVYRNLDWDGEAGGHFENMEWGLETRLNADPGEHVGIFYKKESNGLGGWNYTPVGVSFNDNNMTVSALGNDRVYSGNDENKNIANAEYYRSIQFKLLGSFDIEYTELPGQEGEKKFVLPVDVDLPGLGAYESTDKSMDTWLSEVDFTQNREVLIIPHEVDMANADLAKSEFKIDNVALTYDGEDKMYTGTTPEGASVSITPYKEGDLIKHFAVTVLSAPFGPDFRMFAKIKDSNDNEIAYKEFNFFGRINKAGSTVNGGSITITEGTPGTVYFSDLGRNAAKYYAFTATDLAGGKAYAFSLEGYTAGGGVKSDGAMLYLFDENWKLIDESNWENLSDEGRVASIGNSELVKDKTYYIAVYNGHSAEVNCGFELTGIIVDVPVAPTVTAAVDEGIGVSGVMVSGAVAGQKYEIYSLVGEKWQHRGTRDFDINMDGDEHVFFNAFDLVMDGETVTQFAAAISKNGVEGPWETLTSPIPIKRADTNSFQPLNVEVLHYPESSDLMVTASNGVFANGVYYRLRHERPDGFWDFHGSFIGNGTNTVFCGCDGELTYSNTDGRYIVAAYSEGSDDVEFRLGWTYAVNVEKNGQTTDGIGSFDYDRPTKWLVIGEENFDQNNRGQRLLGHPLSDGRTKFRLVTYDGDAAGDKYTFSQPLNVSDGLTASAGLTLTDMTGDEVEFVKFSFAEMGEYTVSYTDGAGTYKVILSANSPAAPDVFEYTVDRTNGKADITINIQSLRGREGETVHAFFALYEGGRLVGIATRNPVLRLNGFDDNVTVNFNPASNPNNCKAFVLSGGSYAPATIAFTKIVPAPLLTKIETSMGGGEIWLTFDKDMADPTGKYNQFTVYVNGQVRAVTAASLKEGDSKTIVLTLGSSLVSSEDIKIAYTPGDVAAADGGLLGAIIPEGMMTMQEGDPAFTAGVVSDKANVGTELTVGPGTLTVQTNLTYIWFRSDDQIFDPETDVGLGTTGTKYTPLVADKGKYLIVHVSTPDAAGEKYAVIQVEQ